MKKKFYNEKIFLLKKTFYREKLYLISEIYFYTENIADILQIKYESFLSIYIHFAKKKKKNVFDHKNYIC